MNLEVGANATPTEQAMGLAAAIIQKRFPLDPGNKDLGEVLRNRVLFNLSGQRTLQSPAKPEDKFNGILVHGILEISSSLTAVRQARTYFRRSPSTVDKWTSSHFLAFVVDAYLNEVYILKERLKAYPPKLRRAAREGSEAWTSLKTVEKELTELVESEFHWLKKIRSSHVHGQRFRDEEIEHLSLLEFLNRDRGFPMMEEFYRTRLRQVRKSWDQKFATNEKAISGFVDQYFKVILLAILDKDSALRRFR